MRTSPHRTKVWSLASLLALGLLPAWADGTNAVPALTPLPPSGLPFLRVMGALMLVIGIFLGGVWLFRNWQRLALRSGTAPKLNVLEVRSLGGRQALYVIGYDRERFLVSATPTGINLLTHLPTAEAATESTAANSAAPMPPALAFGQVLAQMLKGK